jgi:signal transduction histidine kinase
MQLEDLRALFIFDGVSDDKLRQLLAAGEEVQFYEGMELFREAAPADWWWVLVDGLVELVRQAGREEPVVMRMDRPGLWAGGFRAWDQASSYLATGRGASEGRMFRVPSAALGELARDWFPFGVHLIEGFFQTVRMMDSLSRQREALIALGTLAAGLAHELNNPASATARAVDALQETCDTLLASLAELAESSLSREQFVALDRMRRDLSEAPVTIGSLALVDCEEAISDWLEARGVVNAWRIAPPLAAAGVDVDWCVSVSTILSPDTLEPGLDWVAGTLSTRSLLSEVKESTARISGLVDAVKSYSQLDRASLQLTDVTEGIESSLVMLSHKIGEDVTIVREYDAATPRIEVIPGELNQVWTNLIDNAVDAMEGKGTLRISTRLDTDALVVEIGDTGGGMPPDVQARAFEPFFTTKAIGHGTGLGLDISRRIIADRHHGSIAIESSPQGTVLRVRLPRDRAATAGTRQN